MTVPPEVARALSRSEKQELLRKSLVERISRPRTAPASFAQERLWFVDQVQGASGAYNLPCALRLSGTVNVPALERALGEIVRRHEALRTTFADAQGSPVQVIAPFTGFALQRVDLPALDGEAREAEVRRLAADDAARPFDLAAGPLFRATLLRVADGEHVLLLCMHHIVSDGWSMGVLFRELSALYDAFAEGRPSPLPELPVQYAEHAARQRARLEGEALERQLAWWTERLAGAPALLELPTDHPRPAVQGHRGAREVLDLSARLAERLEAVGRGERATPYMVLLGAFQVLLSKYAGSDDVVVGSVVSGRGDRDVEELIGFFVNTVALRTDLSGDPSFREVLRRVRAATVGAYQHQEVPFERLVEELQPERTSSHSPLFQVMFTLNDAHGARAALAGLRTADLDAELSTTKFDLALSFAPHARGLRGVLAYRTDLFERETVRRMLRHLERVLEQVADDADLPLSRLELLDDAERVQVLEGWNRTDVEYPADRGIHHLFEEQADATPDAIALVFDDPALTYGELNARANRLAHHLRGAGVGAETRVGLCLERGMEMIVSILAILKAGGAYVPLDTTYPAERLELMLADSGAAVLLTQEALRDVVPARAGVRVVSIDGERAAIDSAPAGDLRGAAGGNRLAYVMYTSGSTGTPKGVGVEHRSVIRLVRGANYVSLGADEVILQAAPVSFDASTLEIWGALLNGGRLVLMPGRTPSVEELGRTIVDRGVTTLWLTAGLFQVMVEERLDDLRGVRQLLAGGDVLPVHAVSRVRERFPRLRLINGYGPTENTTFTCCHTVGDAWSGGPVPIGAPISNTRVYVLDRAGLPVPAGVPGELYTGGDGVARGYLGRPAATAERFVPNPFASHPGARMYRTGDRVRWTEGSAEVRECVSAEAEDGALDTHALTHSRTHALQYLGRMDRQVKIRGFRIEPGEVATVLHRMAGVRECAVIVREDAPGEKRLVAYVAGDVDADALRGELRRTLPDYMVPSAFVALDALPLTPNGKLDTRALPAPERVDEDAYVAPRTPAEETLAGIWAEVLGLERVGTADDFFRLGGHSLMATRAISRIRQVFGVELSVRALFDGPTVAQLAECVDALRRAGAPVLPPVVPVDRTEAPPLSFAQERLWFLDQMQGASGIYNVPAALRLAGALDAAALERALGEIVRRHEALRTVFGEAEGGPVQVIAPFAGFSLAVEDLSALGGEAREAEVRRRAADDAARPFSLAAGPLFRATLLRLADDEHVLLVCIHHVASDGWSMGVLFRELAALYGAYREGRESPLAPLPVQYADYAVWQRAQLAGETLERQLAWWKGQLAGAPALLELPTDRPRPAAQSYRGARQPVAFSAGLLHRLESLARREGGTLYMVLLGAFQVLLGKYAGTDDVVVGSPVAGRTRRETEELIGFFVNTLALRTDLSGDPSFREVLRRVRAATLGAHEHQDLPFERLVEEVQPERSLSHSPLFQVVFTLEEAGSDAAALPGLRTARVEAELASTKFDLTLALTPDAAGLRGVLAYGTDLFDRGTIRRMTGHLERVLEQIADDADLPLSRLNLLGDAERVQVLEGWNRTDVEYPADRGIHHLFEEQADATPDAVAVVLDDETLTYGELNARANRLAHHLRGAGVGAETRVGLCLERGMEMIVSILAILKAGGAYVPLDTTYPAERLELMLADSGAAVLLTQEALRDVVPARAGVRVVSIDGERAAIDSAPAGDLRGAAGGNRLAYVMYTSGSTGTPKGVGVEHRSVVRLVRGANYASLGADEVILQAAPVSFDASTLEIWGALLNGGRLVPVPGRAPSLEELGRAIVRHGVTTLWLTAGLFQVMVEERLDDLAGVSQLLTGGDVLPVEAVRRVRERFPALRLINGYGPTENTTVTCCHTISERWTGGPVPIGIPVSNTQVYVLDRSGRPLPVSVPGELYAGGDGVARGYLGRPSATAERFIPDPFSPTPGARMYRTGDRVRWRSDGTVDFLGRMDRQVKIRGFRIEPGEVATVLHRMAGVRECAVIVREDAPGEKGLVAYVAGDADVDALRGELRRTLPDYMVPSAFVALDALPLTPNGKVDTRALPAPERMDEDAYVAPRTPVEATLAEIWAEVLGVERVGTADDFFRLGGHSLMATRVVSRIRERFAVELRLSALFEAPTVAQLAERVQALADEEVRPAVEAAEAPRTRELPLSFSQERLWFLDRLQPESAFYNVPAALRLTGPLNAAALGRALAEIVRRHEALRTAFPESDGRPVQVVAPFAGFDVPVEDISSISDDAREEEVRRRALDDAAAPFDLAAGPPFRATLLRLSDDDHVLLLCMHHIVSDGWSMGVLFRELSALYGAYREGRPSPLAPLPVQFADYAVRQRAELEGETLERQLAYWKARLAGAPALLELPADRPRPAVQTYRGAHEPIALSAALTERLEALGRAEGATLYMVLLAAFQVLLARHGGSDDVVVGSPVAGRTRRETEELIGFFVNTMVLRTDLSGDPTFREVVRRVRAVTLGAYEHQDLPFERLVEELQPDRSLSHSPLVQVSFALRNTDAAEGGLADVQARRVEAQLDVTKFDLTLGLAPDARGLRGGMEYSTDLFDRGTIRRMIEHLERVLEQAVDDPGRRISRLELMSPAERARVVGWNRPRARFPEDRCIHQLFQAQAERTPDATAVVHGEESLTFRELDARANQLARHLRGRGVGPEVRVGVCLERSLELMVCILGVMKAGGAYVPVDPSHPAERIGYVLQDSGVALLLTQARLHGRIPAPAGVESVRVDAEWARIAAERAEPVESGVTPENLCYVIYTSGSTGRPKGVAMHHRGVCNYIHWGIRFYGADRGNGSPVFSSMAVDLTITNLLALFAGRPVRLLSEEAPVEALAQALRQGPGFGPIKITPVHLSLLTPLLSEDEARAAAHTLVIGADFLPAEPTVFWQDHAPGVRLMNEYGPTETVVGCSAYVLPNGRHRAGTVPVGPPIQNLRFYVLDARGEPVPVGLPGELYIGGVGVARGYLGRAALTAEKFVPEPFAGPGDRMYRTGDRARWLADGNLVILGRTDNQVKVRGYRVEPGEIEAELRRHPAVRQCLVVVREDRPGDRRLVAYVVGDAGADALREHLRQGLPEYMVPSAFVALPSLPQTQTGKLDPKTLPAPEYGAGAASAAPRTGVEEHVAGVWREVLGVDGVGVHDNFFDLGGTSLLLYRVFSRLRELRADLRVVDLFRHTTVEALARHLGGEAPAAALSVDVEARPQPAPASAVEGADGRGGRETDVAVVGMSCRFPGARDTDEFWRNLCAGTESIARFSPEELRGAGVAPELLADPDYVPAYGALDAPYAFDAAFFGISHREAQVMDPQHRVFLECAWSALEDAGCDPARFAGAVGVYAGSGFSNYAWRVMADPELSRQVSRALAVFANDKDFLTTRASYRLGLRGPSVAVQTACSTSLVAIHMACRSLLGGECDMALAGGVTIYPEPAGYRYDEGGILSPDGHCRAFDARAAGTVGGSGAGVVALKRLSDALRDGDTIHAVVRGSAINNDGAAKVGFTAPSVEGQRRAIAEALAAAGVSPAQVSYVETHGTGTALGDPIEIAALAEVFGAPADGRPFCALGAVKTNVGHLDTAAGVAGFIKTVLALRHGALPPTLHFESPNPETGLQSSPFYVNAALRPWESDGPRIAGVSSFGMGGTNAHVVLQQAPALPAADSADSAQLLVLSAKSEPALERMRGNLAAHLSRNPGLPLADAAFTLQEGRAAHRHRWAAVARDGDEARAALAGTAPRRAASRRAAERPSVAFLFPGQGTQYAGMARELYAAEPVFRGAVDACAQLLEPELGMDLRAALFPPPGGEDEANALLRETRFTQPALFTVEYALAQLWMSWGVRPHAMLGHSIGEYVAACLAGVFTLRGALHLVAARGRLMQALPAGSMLAVPLPEGEVRPLLTSRLSLAAVNSAAHCVVSGGADDVDAVLAALSARSVEARRLHTSHAFHSASMDPILDAFAEEVRRARPAAPTLPFLSNVTGDWITAGQATDPGYWVRHLRQTVRFADGVARLLEDSGRVLLEVGPGETLGTFARRHPGGAAGRVIVRSLPRADRPDDSCLAMLEAAGALWTAGVPLEWAALRGARPGRRIPLPTYPFARDEHRLSPAPQAAPVRAAPPVCADAGVPASHPSPLPRQTDPMILHVAAAERTREADHRSRIAAQVTELFARLLGMNPDQLDAESSFLELGADSLLLMQLSRNVETAFGVRVPFRRLLAGLATIGELADHLAGQVPPPAEPEPEPAPAPAAAEAAAPPAVESPVHAVAEPAAPMVVHAAPAPVFAPPAEGGAAPAGNGGGLQDVVSQQIALMREQLALLRGAGSAPATVSAAPAALPMPMPMAPAAPIVPAPSASSVSMVQTAPAMPAAPAAAIVPAPSASSVSMVQTAPAPAAAEASHGPHRPVRQTMSRTGPFNERQARHYQALVERYTARTRGSREYAAASRPRLSDNRASLGFRLATKELMYPIVGERSQGTRLWDVDGNEYVDFTIGFGVHFFGHRAPFIVQAVEEQLSRGFHTGPQSDLAGPTAALFSELTGMERVTFCNTGSEAVMTALRIARTVTGRDRIVLFEGSYHGCFDGILARPAGRGAAPGSRPVAAGTPQGMIEDVVVLPYGTPEALEWLRANASTLAAVLVEPVQSNFPENQPREFLHQVRALTEQTGTVLIFDEMITGLRLHAHGAQGWYGIEADLATYGKVIGGGFPLGVVAGKARYMDAIDGGQWQFGDDSFPAADQTFFAGTFCKHPVVLAAANAVLRHLQAQGPALYEELHARAARLVAGLRAVLEEEQVPVRILHTASLFRFVFRPEDPYVDLLFYHMLERGIYVWEGRGCFVSPAHTDQDCDRMVQALRESIHALREGGFLPEIDGPSGGPGGGSAANLPADLKLVPAASSGSTSSGSASTASSSSTEGPRAVPLTPAQRQVWVHAQLGDDASRAYNEQFIVGVRGALDQAALRAAVGDLARHHEALRTVFDPSGEVQHVFAAAPDPLPVFVHQSTAADGGEAGLREALGRGVAEVFDLAAGPLFRVHVHPAGADRQVLQFVVHHVVADGLATHILQRDLETAYGARCQGRAPELARAMQFSEYTALLAADAREHAAYEGEWLARFGGAVPLALPTDHARPRFPTSQAAVARHTLDAELSLRLRALSRQQGCTLFMTLLGGLLATLHRTAGQDDLVVGISSAGRPFPGADSLVGHCVDVLPIRSRVADGTRGGEFLRGVRDSLLDAYEHEAFSYARLHEALQIPRGPGVPPLISVTFNLEPGGGAGDGEPRTFAGLPVEPVRGVSAAFTKFDLTIDAVDTGTAIDLVFLFNTGLFERPTVQRLAAHLQRVLEQLAGDAELRLADLALIGAEERRMVVDEWNRTEAAYPAELCIHQLFQAQAQGAPHAVAVTFGDASLTFGELDDRANRLANHLVRMGVGPEVRVGICLERGLEMMVCILGVMKAGGAYVPVDPSHPAERIGYVLEDSDVAVVLTQARLRDGLAVRDDVRVIAVDAGWERIASESAAAPETGVTSENLAYVIYTSGSTGRPKGVAMHHRGVINYIDWGIRAYGADRGNGSPVFSSMAVDLTITNLLPLFAGLPVRLLPEENAVEALAAALREKNGFGAIKITPVHLSLLTPLLTAEEARDAAHTLVIGADFLSAEPTVFWQDNAPGVRLMNEYGPTETVVGCSAYELPNGLHRNGAVPVGGPIQNITFYVLDGRMQPVPVGVPGELYIGGVGVARGYLGRPALSAEKFVPNPFAGGGARMYRTGDRARWLEGGNLTVLGRTDSQVKVRGYRVELGEIEAVLRRHESVSGAIVVVREDVPGDPRLVAYVVSDADPAELRAYLRQGLPEHMVPAAFVPLAALPRTATGKIDPKTLPAPEYGGAEERYAAPRTPAERALAEIWAEVLRLERVGATDDFFELGGNSLLATRVVSRIRQALGVELTVRALFESPTVARLAACVGAPRGTERAQLPPVVAVERAGDLPLSFGQERLWFLQRLQPESPFYNVACAVRLRGALDARALERALGEIVRRHEPLRTRFRDAEGVPAQVIAPFHGFELPVDDLSALPGEARDAELRRRAQADAETPFDLARGPLFRARLLALGDEDNALLLCMHHAVCDGWSVGIFFRELSALYVAFRDGVAAELDDLPVQYADFAAWQRRHLVGEALDGQLAWWKERLAGAPALLELPTDLPRPAVQTYRGAHEPVELSGALLERLETLGRAEGASLFMVLLGAFQLLLARYAGVEDVVVGSPVAGRTRSEVEGLIGFFVNTLVLRTDLSGDPSFRALLARVREATLGAFEHQDVPFERLVEELQPGRSLSHTPLVQVSFVLQNLDPAGDGLPGLRTERVGAGLDVAKFDLTLTLTPGEDGLRGTLEYGTDLFEAGTARRMVRHLERVLEQVADDPDRRLSTLELADQLERVRMKGWNRTGAPYPAERCIHQLFQAQAERTPHAVAVTFESASLTFGELDERANRLANHLVRLGVGPEVRVGICLERSLEMMVCILGVMKAGGAYVPVDPSHPAERIGYVLEDAGVAVVLTQARLADAVPAPADARVVCVDAAWERIATESAAAPETGVTSENLCYVIYTSGSTGRPKGVAMHHRGVINYIDWGIRAYGADQGNGSPVFSSMAVDLTITNLLPLFAGLPVRLLPEENAVEALAAALREKNGFGAIKITPVHLSLLTPLLTAEEARDAAHTLVIGADFLSAEPTVFWQDNAPGVRLMNEYGPTETVVGCSAYTLPNGVHRNGPVPVGGPIQNITFHVLDAHGQPVPLGLPGELYIGGVGVARGYLGRPALTAEKFVPDPFAGGGARMYRTGDRARWLEGGNLTILGRTDHQVKVRGYRVEPGEVEAALRRHPSVSGAIVVVREDVPGDRRLVAYVAGDADADALREHLRQSLPEYMVPSAFVTMQALPRTATGKIDPKTLPAPEYGAARATYVAPRTEVEHALAEIWAEVLHVERVGATDDFFALGGHSLLLMRMAARLQAVFGLEVSIRTVFALPTLEALAAEVERRIYEDILAMSETEAEQLSELEPAMGD